MAALEGAAELDRLLQKLGKKVAGKIATKALRAGAVPTRAQAKTNALTMVGGEMGIKLAAALVTRVTPKGRKKTAYEKSISVMIDPKKANQFKSRSKAGRVSYIPSAIEYGHDNAKAIPFMRGAAMGSSDEAIKRIMNAVRAGVLSTQRFKAKL